MGTMTLEPCPYCGGPVRYELGVMGAICLDPACFYEGPIDDEGAEKHNRLARLVRAAKKWAQARRTGTMREISETGDELIMAVEGGSGGMKLYVTFVNTLPWEELHIIPQRRIVEVEMTPEQVEKLAPMRVGRVCGKDRYEEIETCVLQAVERGVER